ncbi:hypothetical protein ATO10_09438 [Actibacterium atlanticum]|uniref:Uncharacterized protein n=1 Tax=Actibacterium atlanticum TaxID=1461693 RepID=A0A058ZKA7_9RHOB|nr:hypothetical protein [Actibacterium atlanticum]KCV82059.1 hypothetical protein ATO10_09438 [Actibacterium atlanticum]
MCIPPEALALFLNIISATPVTSEPGMITVHADAYDTVWVAREGQWCTAETAAEGWARRYAMAPAVQH